MSTATSSAPVSTDEAQILAVVETLRQANRNKDAAPCGRHFDLKP